MKISSVTFYQNLPTHSPGVRRNVSPGQRGAGGGLATAACQSAFTNRILTCNHCLKLLLGIQLNKMYERLLSPPIRCWSQDNALYQRNAPA